MILLVLALLWIAVLAPGIWRRRSERRSSGSIDTFHHQLHLLERTGPKLVAPAYRLQTATSGSGLAPGQSGYPTVSSMPGRPNLVLLRPIEEGSEDAAAPDVTDDAHGVRYRRVVPPMPDVGATPPPEPPRVLHPERDHYRQGDHYRRKMAQRRRRDILAGLLLTFVLTGILGVVHSFRPLWVLTLVSGLGLVAYVVLIHYAQRLVAPARPHRAAELGPAPAVGADPFYRSRAGYPGAWDEQELYGLDDRYGDPVRVAAVR
jgi:hypothetical protein